MTAVLCDSTYHYDRCEYPDVETCQNGPSWHWNVLGEGGHCTGKCDGVTCPKDENG